MEKIRKPNRYEQALLRLPDTLEWSQSLDIDSLKHFLLEKDGLPRIFLGSGGSLSAAQLATLLSVENGIAATAMTPYNYICSPWKSLPAKVFIFSAGGRNIDAFNAYKTASNSPSQQFGALIMTSSSILEDMMDRNGDVNKFIYPLTHRDSFLATNSLIAFYSLLFRVYRNENVNLTDWNFREAIETVIPSFIESTYNLPTEEWDEHNAALYKARETDRFYALYSPDAMPIAVDLESRFSESSVGCLQISDYRNFAHGRFNWFSQRVGQTGIIAIITPESKDMVEEILREIPDYIPVFKLSTTLKGSAGIMELLVKGMEIVKVLGTRWGLDVGAPQVAKFGKVIHRLDFLNPDKEDYDR